MIRTSSFFAAGVLLVMLSACSSKAPDEAATAPDADAKATERAALLARRTRVAADQAQAGGLRILSQAYRHEVQESGWSRPHLDLVLQNDTPLTVSGFTLQISLFPPASREPLLRQELKVPVTAEMLPGQQHGTTLTPSPDSPWGLLVAPADSRMEVQVLSLVTPTGETYLGAGSFDAVDARRLAELESGAD